MNEENTVDSLESPAAAEQERDGLGIKWHLGIGLMAVAIIGILLFSLIGSRQNNSRDSAAATTSGVTPQSVSSEAEAMAQANPDSPEAQFELGNAYYEAGQFDQAVSAYQAAIKNDPNYQAAYANLGVVYYQQQKYNLAVSQYQKALELNQQDGDVAYNLGVLYLQQALTQGGQPDSQLLTKAVAQLEHAQEISPGLAEPLF